MKLNEKQIAAALQNLEGWTQHEDEIRKTFQFENFGDAMVWVNRVAELAHEMDHHPDIDIRFSTVHLALSTHSQKGLTKKDFRLAAQIDEL